MIDPKMLSLPERMTVPAQTKITPTESKRLDALVEEIRNQVHGASVTRSSILRSALLYFMARAEEDPDAR